MEYHVTNILVTSTRSQHWFIMYMSTECNIIVTSLPCTLQTISSAYWRNRTCPFLLLLRKLIWKLASQWYQLWFPVFTNLHYAHCYKIYHVESTVTAVYRNTSNYLKNMHLLLYLIKTGAATIIFGFWRQKFITADGHVRFVMTCSVLPNVIVL